MCETKDRLIAEKAINNLIKYNKSYKEQKEVIESKFDKLISDIKINILNNKDSWYINGYIDMIRIQPHLFKFIFKNELEESDVSVSKKVQHLSNQNLETITIEYKHLVIDNQFKKFNEIIILPSLIRDDKWLGLFD